MSFPNLSGVMLAASNPILVHIFLLVFTYSFCAAAPPCPTAWPKTVREPLRPASSKPSSSRRQAPSTRTGGSTCATVNRAYTECYMCRRISLRLRNHHALYERGDSNKPCDIIPGLWHTHFSTPTLLSTRFRPCPLLMSSLINSFLPFSPSSDSAHWIERHSSP